MRRCFTSEETSHYCPCSVQKPFRAFILRRSPIRTSARGCARGPRGADNVEVASRRVLFTLRVKRFNFPSADNNSPFGVFRQSETRKQRTPGRRKERTFPAITSRQSPANGRQTFHCPVLSVDPERAKHVPSPLLRTGQMAGNHVEDHQSHRQPALLADAAYR